MKKENRTFDTGANRNSAVGKYDYHGFNSPLVDNAYARYMHEHRHLADGTFRDADNWQQGFPTDVLIESLYRHIMDIRLIHDGYAVVDENGKEMTMLEALMGARFNINAYAHQLLKETDVVFRGELNEETKS